MKKQEKRSKALYELHKGKAALCDGKTGVICGYGHGEYTDVLIMAVMFGKGWSFDNWMKTEYEIIETHKENPAGYWFVNECNLLDISK